MPSFSIEAEGETNPLSISDILRTLTDSSGVHASQQSLQVATQQLSNWEKTPGYFSLLQDVYADFSLPEPVRFQAIIQLKNGIDKYWRKTSTRPIAQAEKEKLKTQAITVGVREPKQSLALQNALMLAKIVRYEFPHDWPDVISVVIHHLRDESVHVSNILTITLQIIKELASGRLQRTKKSLESVAPELLHVLGGVYVRSVESWFSNNNPQDALDSYSALKTLRRLLIAGFDPPHRNATVKQFWNLLQQHQEKVWMRWKAPEDLLVVKLLLQYSKLYLDMSRTHAASFVSLGCMEILNRSWLVVNGEDVKRAWSVLADDGKDHAQVEKLILKALLLFRACVKMVFNPAQTFKYQHPEDKIDKKTAIDQIRSTVFTDAFVLQLMELLVVRYFTLTPTDLNEWTEEPDEWEKREEEIADAWEFSTRVCSEKLFLDLVINFRSLLVPRLLQVFQQQATREDQDVFLKDSLYSAIGIAAACIEDVFDFNSFVRTTLIPEVQIDQPLSNVLRRRTAILLGQWVPIKPESLDRAAIYQIFTFLLSKNDHVVRVTAGRQLRLVLEPFEFKFEDFEPYVAPILSAIMRLISETELTETKMALLETVRVVVTKLEDKIEPYAQDIMSVLPSLWTASGEEHLMKQAILTMITAIISSLGPRGQPFHGPVLSLIHDAVQIDSEAIVYLLEDALDLWAAILQQTPTESPELLALMQSLVPLLEMGSEHLRQCFELIESYTALCPSAVLNSSFLTPVLTSMTGLLGMLSNRARDASLAPRVVENLIATVAVTNTLDDDSRKQATKHLVECMITTGYLPQIWSLLKQAYDYHQDPRPNKKPPDVLGVGETTLFTLLARLALLAPELVFGSVDAWVVVEWLNNFDAIGDAMRKKLQVLGVTNLLGVVPTILLEELQSLMNIWTDVVVELSDGAEQNGDYLWSGLTSSSPEWPGETPEDTRKREITNSDPTYTYNIREFISARLRQVVADVGGPQIFEQQHLSRVDPVVVKSFTDLKL